MTSIQTVTACQDETFRSDSIENQIFLNLNSSQVKAHDQLTGEILLDIKKAIYSQCSVILTIECKERVYRKNECIFEDAIMSVRSEVYQIKSDSKMMMIPNVYKIPLNIEISEIFDSSQFFKLDNDLCVKVDYDLFCQVVQYQDLSQNSQVKMINKINDATKTNDNTVNQVNQDISNEQDSIVLFQSSVVPLQIINNSKSKKSEPFTITQQIPRRQRSLFRSIGSMLCCKGSRESQYKENDKQKNDMKLKDISHFNLDVNTINLYPGEAFSFIINDDSKKPDLNNELRYSARLVSRSVIKVNGNVYLNDTKILYEKEVAKNVSEKVTIPYQSQLSFRTNVFRNSYELQVVPIGVSFNDKFCLKMPIHVNAKKFKLIPLKSDILDGSENEQLRQSLQRLLTYPCKVIAKIQLKFDEQFDDQKDLGASQRSTKQNTPDITPLKRSFE